jgi:hypothetical protein
LVEDTMIRESVTVAAYFPSEVDRLLRWRKGSCAALIESGQLRAIPVGTRRRVTPEALNDYLAGRAPAPAPKRRGRKAGGQDYLPGVE